MGEHKSGTGKKVKKEIDIIQDDPSDLWDIENIFHKSGNKEVSLELEKKLLELFTALKNQRGFYKYYLEYLSAMGYSLGYKAGNIPLKLLYNKHREIYRNIYQVHVRRLNTLAKQTEKEIENVQKNPEYKIIKSTLGNSLSPADLIIFFQLSQRNGGDFFRKFFQKVDKKL